MSVSPAGRDGFARDLVQAAICRVEVHEGESSHFEVTEEGYVVMSLVTHQHGVPCKGVLRGGPAWEIPQVGTEGVVLADGFSDDGFEGELWFLPFAKGPAGLAPGVVFVLGSTVEVRDAGGVAEALATKEDLDALADWISTTMVVATPAGNSTPGTTTSPPAAAGTSVLKGQ